jgi:hypothetical protein
MFIQGAGFSGTRWKPSLNRNGQAVSLTTAHTHGVFCPRSRVQSAPASAAGVHRSTALPHRGVIGLQAKKGKPNAPLAPPSELEVPEDGTPVFAILARSPVSGLWYPLGTMRGDGRAKMLVNAMRTSWGRKFYGDTLNKGVARSVFSEQGRRMIHAALHKYSALRKYTADDLEYGYRVIAKDFDYPTQMIRPEQAMSLIQWLKMKLGRGKPPSIAMKDESTEWRK